MVNDFQASNHCVFCRNNIPNLQNSLSTGDKTWENNVLISCDLSCTEAAFGIITAPADLNNLDRLLELTIKNRASHKPLTSHISMDVGDEVCETNRIAYFVHVDCWKMVNKLSARQLSNSSSYKFAQSTCPLLYTKRTKGGRIEYIPSYTEMQTADGAQTNLAELINYLAKLPIEIQLSIAENCHQTMFQSLVMARESSKLIGFMKKENPTQNLVDQNCTVETISFRSVSIFGHNYISLLRFNSRKIEGQSELRVRKLKIKGIRFAIDLYGLRAISILYTNNSISPWLGDEAGTWKGVVYGNNLKTLRITKDALKYLRIDFSPGPAAAKHPVMWDKDINLFGTHRILETADYCPRIREFPGWRLCRYLSLLDAGKTFSGLTVYCYLHGITGISSQGDLTILIGSRQGCAIHLPLYHNERILSVWVRTPGDAFDVMVEPTMLVTTSFNRCRIFGPYLSPSVTRARQYGWTNLCDVPNSRITGLFFDALSVSSSSQITSIGITSIADENPSMNGAKIPRIRAPRTTPALEGTISIGLFLSVAKLSNIWRLKLRKVGCRCVGMCIYYSDDTIEVLGQWDPSQPSEIIYGKDSGILESLTFQLSGSISSSFVENITINEDQSPIESSPTRRQTFFKNQTVAWWFTEWYDRILLWDGTIEDITLSAPKKNIIDLE